MVTQMQAIIDRLIRGPLGLQVAAEIEAERLERRKDLAAQIQTIRANEEQQAPKLREAEGKAMAAYEKALKVYESARLGLAAAQAEVRRLSVESNLRVSRLEKELRDSADWETINEFRHMVDTMLEEARHGRVAEGDYPLLHAKILYLTQAHRDAEALALEALAHDELASRLDKIRAGVPVV